MSELKKPRPKTRRAYDYNECRDWLEVKYGYDERDYARRYDDGGHDATAPYRDFWHFVLDMEQVHNGCYITIKEDWLEDAEPWQQEIVNHYLRHFGRVVDGIRQAAFWVEW
jgi:hypothetical protein